MQAGGVMFPVFYAHADAEEICTRAGEDGSSLLDWKAALKTFNKEIYKENQIYIFP